MVLCLIQRPKRTHRMRCSLSAVVLLLTSKTSCFAGPTDVSLIVSSEAGLRLSPQPPVVWRRGGKCPAVFSVEVFDKETKQQMGGFGASITESSAMNLNALPTEKQSELLEILFGKSGVQLSAIKATMLSNDFAAAAPWSTYDDVAGDTRLLNFSLERDLRPTGVLTFIKRALSHGFKGTIQSYMDYPPDWMLTHSPSAEDHGRVDPKYYDALARYFLKYVQGYSAHGVHIDFLEAFNEPSDSYTNETATTLAMILGEHIGPVFEKAGLWPKQIKLTYGGQCSRETAAQFIPAVMQSTRARKYMDVLVYHGYDCQFEDDGSCNDTRQRYDAIEVLGAKFPGRPLWMTEICYAYNGDDPNCTHSSTLQYCTDYPRSPKLAPPLPRRDFADGATWGHRIVKEVRAGASGWIYWNMLLDSHGGPYAFSPKHADDPNNFQHPLVIVDTSAGTFEPTGLFYFLAHFSKFVRPGAVQIGLRDEQLPNSVSAVAFATSIENRGANGADIVLQLVNRATSEQIMAICAGTNVAHVRLPPTSITTAMW